MGLCGVFPQGCVLILIVFYMTLNSLVFVSSVITRLLLHQGQCLPSALETSLVWRINKSIARLVRVSSSAPQALGRNSIRILSTLSKHLSLCS